MSLFATASDPKHSHISDRVFRLVLWIVPIVALYMTVMVYGKALQYEVDITRASFILMAVIFIIVGNYLPKSRQNYTVGIKTRWALDDPENWDRTHRFGGYVFMVGGFLILILAILPTLLPYAVLIVAACIGILPTIYSFLFYLKKQK